MKLEDNLEAIYKDEKALEDDLVRIRAKVESLLDEPNKTKTVIINPTENNFGSSSNIHADMSKYVEKKRFAEFSNNYNIEIDNVNNNIEDIKKSLEDLIENIKVKNLATEDAFRKIEELYLVKIEEIKTTLKKYAEKVDIEKQIKSLELQVTKQRLI